MLHRLLLVVVLLGVCAPAAEAQNPYNRIEETRSTVAYFYHALPGEATIQVSVWGTVPRPGIYEVAETTRLDKLLTMAGGAPIEARSENQDADITIRLFRGQGSGPRQMIYEASLEELLRNADAYPTLQGEDVVVVETQLDRGIGWLEVIGIVGSVASLALTVDRLFFR